ncbi:MAG: sporulation protein YunB [Syntrophomonadaceae bacterium]|nr:sporulation protein YunB [Syntrophomonadaceae bacterium]
MGRPGSLFTGLLSLLLSLILVLASFLLLESRLRPGMLEAAGAMAQQAAVMAMNQAVKEQLDGQLDYSNLMLIHKDNQGKIVLMQPETFKLNRLAAGTTMSAQQQLNQLAEQSFSFPLGQAFQSPLLASYGPRVGFKIKPLGVVRTRIEDRFEAAGINQTRHRIYLSLESDLLLVLPLVSQPLSVTTTMPLVENIIVGEVPSTYLNLDIAR